MFANDVPTMFANAQRHLKGRLIAPHQHDGVEWMLRRETAEDGPRGGILADEMGLGKTVQTIATTLGNPGGQTLIIVPKSLQIQWVEHIQTFTDASVQQWKPSVPITDSTYVVATYGQTLCKKLNSVRWHRLVLDEAHRVKNKNSKASKCIASIHRDITWCLTGTPIIRSPGDVISLLAVIGETNPSLDTERIRNTYILRRTFEDLCAACPRLKLPQLNMHVHEVSLTDDEKRAYNDIVMYGRFAVRVAQSMVLEGGDRREATNHIFEIMLRLQQAVVSPTLCMEIVRETRSRIFSDVLTDASHAPYDDCPICMDTMTNPSATKCNHWFCSNCIAAACGCKMACPMCRAPIETGDIAQSMDTTEPGQQGMPLSTKFSKVVDLVNQIPDKKVIVFTHWRQEQRELYDEITKRGRPARIISGSTSMEERHAIVHDFNEGTDPMVLIANIQTTSTGLNLQAAKAVIFPSLDWSPCLELQAIARVHRIGVDHPVDVHRITAPGSIDDRVQNRQLEKLSFASQLLGDKRIESRLSIDSSYGDFLASIFTLIQ
jgi:SNF2 family DNA or RNA helicase